jgi:hypothetical protein
MTFLCVTATPARRRYLLGAMTCALVLAACGKDPVEPVRIATQNTSVPITPVVANAISGRTFTFPGAAAVLAPAATGQNLTLTFGGTSASVTATATITNASGVTTGSFTARVTFGSCIFTITSTTGTKGLTVGQQITVNPCSLRLETAGQQADGQPQQTNATVTLGTTQSTSTPVQVAVTPDGQVVVNGQPVGRTPTTNVTN